jgi:hypothetical protein
MPNVAVAAYAKRHFSSGLLGQHLMYDFRVAMEAGGLRNAPIPRLDLNRLMKILQRKCQRMKKTVVRLRNPLAERVVGQMAVIADGRVAVTGVLPRIILALHNVTIRTRRWIIA